MNWLATAVAGSGVEMKPLSQEEVLARQDEVRHWEEATIDAVGVTEQYWRK
jgi:hypothetical protein